MRSLQELNDKIKGELKLEYNESEFEEMDLDGMETDDSQEEEDEKKSSRARIRIETESKIRGNIRNLDFEVNFRDLADRVNDEIDGVILTREKAHKLFNIVREFLDF